MARNSPGSVLVLALLLRTGCALAAGSDIDAAAAQEQAQVYDGQGDYGKGAEALELVLKARPRDYQLHVRLAQEYVRLGRLDDAHREFLQARAIDDKKKDAYIDEGYEKIAAGDNAGAREAFDAFVAVDTANPVGRLHLASFLAQTGRIDEADRLFRTLLAELDADPRSDLDVSLHVMQWLGVIRRDQGRLDKSEDILQRALSRAKGKSSKWTMCLEDQLGRLYLRSHRRDRAERAFRAGIGACKPSDRCESATAYHDAMSGLAALLADEGRTREARKAADGVWALFRGAPLAPFPAAIMDAWNLLETAAAYSTLGEPAKAEEIDRYLVASPEFSLHPAFPLAAGALAEADRSAGRLPEAEALCLKAIDAAKRSGRPDGTDGVWRGYVELPLARVYVQQARRDDAERILRAILDECKTGGRCETQPFYRDARGELASLKGNNEPGPRCPGCSVILVTIDVMRADAPRAVDGGAKVMPNLDAMAARAIVFPDAFSPSPDTMPASVSIMNGLYPSHHGALVPLRDQAVQEGWSGNENTLAAVLKRRGYVVRGAPLGDIGAIDEFLGKELPLEKWAEPRELAGKKFLLVVRAEAHDPYLPSYEDVRALNPSIAGTSYPRREDVLGCEIASALARRIPGSLRAPAGDWPALDDPLPDAAKGVVLGTDPAERLRAVRDFDPIYNEYALSSQCFWSFFSSSTIGAARLLYDAKLHAIDRDLGEFLRDLKAKGLLDHALVVVTSQHGEEFLEHGEVNHSSQLYDETVHVPLVLLLPASSEGRAVPGVVSTVDVMPTILGLLGIEPPGGIDGRDLLACAKEGCGKRFAFSEWGHVFSARDDDYSYLRYQRAGTALREELFDRRADPGERRDVSAREPEALARMRAALSSENLGGISYEGRWPAWVSAQVRERIINDGYW